MYGETILYIFFYFYALVSTATTTKWTLSFFIASTKTIFTLKIAMKIKQTQPK